MKYIILFTLILISVTCTISQELVSHIDEGGRSSLRTYLIEYNDESYVMSVDMFDNLTMYKVDNGQTNILHTNHIPDVSKVLYNSYDEVVYFKTSNKCTIYNFITNEYISFDEKDGYQFGWRQPYDNDIILHYSRAGVHTDLYYLVDIDDFTTDTIDVDGEIVAHNSEFVFYKDLENPDLLYSYNKSTKVHKLVYDAIFEIHYFVVFNDVLYMQFFNTIHSYDEELDSIVEEYDYIGTFEKFESNTDVLSYSVYTTQGKRYVIYNEESDEFENYLLPDAEIIYPGLFGDHIIYRTNSDLYIYNTVTSEVNVFDFFTLWASNIEVLADRYVICQSLESVHLIDLQTEESHIILDAFLGGNFDISSIQIFDSIFTVSFESYTDTIKNNLEIDVATYSAEYSSIVPEKNTGINEKPILKKFRDGFLLLSENLYYTYEGVTTQLNVRTPVDFNYLGYRILNDHIYWIENVEDGLHLFEFDGQVKQLVTVFPSPGGALPISIEDVAVTATYAYIIFGFSGGLISYNRLDNSMHIVDAYLSSGNRLYASKENVYLKTLSEMYYINNNELTLIEDLPIYTLSQIFNLNDKIFVTNDRLNKIENGSVVWKSEFELSSIKFEDVVNDSLLILNLENGGIVNYDAYLEEANIIPPIEGYKLDESGGGVIVANRLDSNIGASKKVWSDSDKKYFELDKDLAAESNLEFFTYKNDTLVIVRSNDENEILDFYHLSNKYRNTVLVDSIKGDKCNLQMLLNDDKTNMLVFGKESLVFWDNRFRFLYKDEVPFQVECSFHSSIIYNAGYFYFLGIDPVEGRQIYRIKNLEHSVKLVNKDKQWISIFEGRDYGFPNFIVGLSDQPTLIEDNYFYNVLNKPYPAQDFESTDIYIREESNLVYIFDEDSGVDVLYDFTLEEGDIFTNKYYDSLGVALEVSLVDSIDILGGRVKRIILESIEPSDLVNGQIEWIESVGSTDGLIYIQLEGRSIYQFEKGTLTCVFDSGVQYYQNIDFNGCLLDEENQDYIYINVYPNPTNNIVNLEDFNYSEYKLLSMDGKLISQGRYTNQLELEQFSAGTYLLFLQYDNYVGVGKVVKVNR